MYRVAWKSKMTGKTGRGRPIYTTGRDARLAAGWAQARHRDKDYWAEEEKQEQPLIENDNVPGFAPQGTPHEVSDFYERTRDFSPLDLISPDGSVP